jgi:sugar lactone lactonase YvrE
MVVSLTATLMLAAHAELGESPVWDDRVGGLYWVDTPRHHVHRFDPDSGRDRTVEFDQAIGAVALRARGGLVAAVQDGFAFLDIETGRMSRIAPVEADNPMIRMNDGKCDSRGRFWAGTMATDFREGAGALYRLDPDGTMAMIFDRVTVSNGIDWSRDNRKMYYVDSYAGGIDVFDFDVDCGTVANRHRLVDIENDSASPCGLTVGDGLTVDADGQIWIAIYGAGEVRRYDTRGRLTAVVEVSVPGVTSVAFGGGDLTDLYITTCTLDPGEASDAAGGLFRCRPGVRGLPPSMFAG